MFQLTKVGLPVNVVNGVNPLSNGMINPTGNDKARTDILPEMKRNYQILCKSLLLPSVSSQYFKECKGSMEGGGSMEFSISTCLGWKTARV